MQEKELYKKKIRFRKKFTAEFTAVVYSLGGLNATGRGGCASYIVNPLTIQELFHPTDQTVLDVVLCKRKLINLYSTGLGEGFAQV